MLNRPFLGADNSKLFWFCLAPLNFESLKHAAFVVQNSRLGRRIKDSIQLKEATNYTYAGIFA